MFRSAEHPRLAVFPNFVIKASHTRTDNHTTMRQYTIRMHRRQPTKRLMPEPEALKGFQVGMSRFLDFSSLVDNTTPRDRRVSHMALSRWR